MMYTQKAHPREPQLTTLAACLAAVLASGSVCADAGSPHAGAQGNRALFGTTVSPSPGIAANLRRTGTARPAPVRPAALVKVTNCNDSGPGSLREAATTAAIGDVLDLHLLSCSTISLTSGAIGIPVDNVTLLGPGRDALTIDGNDNGYVLSGYSMAVMDLTIAHGSSPDGFGGCISVFGDLTLTRTTVTGCHAGDGGNDNAYGAGADVRGNLTMQSSTISDSHARAALRAFGGGAYVGGIASLSDSTVSGSSALGGSGKTRGGGLFAYGMAFLERSQILGNSAISVDGTAYGGGIASFMDDVTVIRSTISGNSAHSDSKWSHGAGIQVGDDSGAWTGSLTMHTSALRGNIVSANCTSCVIQGGGAHAFGAIRALYSAITDNHVISAANSGGHARGGGFSTLYQGMGGFNVLISSTMSGNSAIGGQGGTGEGGGMVTMYDSPLVLLNSTVAFNRASTRGGGAIGGDANGTYASTVISSIVANNEAPEAADLGSQGSAFTIAGNNSLVVSVDSALTLPPDTLRDDPKLLPLAANGGPTLTHALATCSPAIDKGSNDFPGLTFEWDQRGDPFVRQFGGAADIGAFELQPDADAIFSNGFEAPMCP